MIDSQLGSRVLDEEALSLALLSLAGGFEHRVSGFHLARKPCLRAQGVEREASWWAWVDDTSLAEGGRACECVSP